MSLRPTLDFLLYDWLHAEQLTARERFADHSRETFDAVLDTCERIAREKYAPFNRTVDIEEPRFDGEKVILPQATHDAHKAYAQSGMLSAAQDYEIGGMQLPYTVEAAAQHLLRHGLGQHRLEHADHGQCQPAAGARQPTQKEVFALNEFSRPLVRHHVPVRAAGRLVAVGHRDARRARRRRFRSRSARPALPPHRQQDVDLGRRARAHREHRPPGAGQDPGAGRQADSRHARHLAVHRAEEAGRHRRAN